MDDKEFYEKFWKADGKPMRLFESEYFDLVNKALDEGKQLIISKGRTRPPEEKYWRNKRTFEMLTLGKKVIFMTPDIEKSVKEFEYWTKHKLFYKKQSDNQYIVSLTSFS
jgi:hypothetical protein